MASVTVTRQSLSEDQSSILDSIRQLHNDGKQFECDATYGNGSFYKGTEPPALRFDSSPQVDGVTEGDAEMLPLQNGEINSMILDPPFLTYIRANRGGNGDMAMSRRYSGYWTYNELLESYHGMISEASRVIADGGTLTFKCQDIVHNHKLEATHVRAIEMASLEGFRLLDLFVLYAKNRMPSPQKGKQRHARIHHSYFLVFKKLKGGSNG